MRNEAQKDVEKIRRKKKTRPKDEEPVTYKQDLKKAGDWSPEEDVREWT